MFRRTATVSAGLAFALLALAPAASAHVTVQPPQAPTGSYAKLAFRVPNESDTAATVKVEVQLPDEIESARTKPTPGWRASTADRTITWDGGRIEPGEFQEFEIAVGPLPEDIDQLVFKAIQTYEDGEVAAWVEEAREGEDEPERPAPVLRLVDGDPDGDDRASASHGGITSLEDDVDGARAVGIIGIVVGTIGLATAVAALAASRRRA